MGAEKLIDPKLLRTDGGTQMRDGCDKAVVDEYAEAMRAGAKFPPVHAFEDESGALWPGDGHHRAAAAIIAKKKLRAVIEPGGRRAAILFATGANGDHGLRRTNADKRRSVSTLLADDEWSSWSDRRIAEHAGVSNHLVASLRAESGGNGSHVTARKGADGKTYAAPAPRPKAEPMRVVERVEVHDDDGWVIQSEEVVLHGEEGPDYEEGPGLPPDATEDEDGIGESARDHLADDATPRDLTSSGSVGGDRRDFRDHPPSRFRPPSYLERLSSDLADLSRALGNVAAIRQGMIDAHVAAFESGEVREVLEKIVAGGEMLLAFGARAGELVLVARQAAERLTAGERAA